ncbi:MAG: glutamine amidotransferase family protein [Actinomycetota bacterium]
MLSSTDSSYRYEKDISGCSLTGFINRGRERVSGSAVTASICNMNDRCNGLGAGYAAYGIYPEYRDDYAFHMLYTDETGKEQAESLLNKHFRSKLAEEMPTRRTRGIADAPLIWRYFLQVDEDNLHLSGAEEEDYVVNVVMKINATVKGAFVMSSGKNMGAFKAVGFPEDVSNFYRLEEYEGWTWIAHGRFPTNTPGWWGGAHPFCLLDWAIVHNGEISSYGINKRYLEMFGYKCTLMTDTEVVAYAFDLLLRRHKLPMELATQAITAPFWTQIDQKPAEQKKLLTAVRQVYGGVMMNGPFAFILGHRDGLLGLNDRIKLRPLVAAEKGDTLYIANEEAGIREIAVPDRVWMPTAGEPVIALLKPEKSKAVKEDKVCLKT